jgi:hypothetical protein
MIVGFALSLFRAAPEAGWTRREIAASVTVVVGGYLYFVG